MNTDEKLDLILPQLVMIKAKIIELDTKIDNGVTKVILIPENDIKPGIQLMVENYTLPA